MPKKRNRDRDGLYQRPDSPYWQASYIDQRGRRIRRSTQTENRREAETLLSKWKLEARQSKHWNAEPERTFDELILAYLQETKPYKRAPQRDGYSAKHLYKVFTGWTLTAITPIAVRQYISKRKAEGAGASTINREIGLLSAAFNYAQREWGWQVDNPARNCKQKEPQGRVRWLSAAEAQVLMAVAANLHKSPHLADLIRLALNTGMRKGELLGLEWNRINLQANLIYLEAMHTKSGSRRSVPINSEARIALLNRARFKAEHCPGSRWVFCHTDGTRIKDCKKGFRTACNQAGIEDFRFHDLRHTCAAWLVTAGVPLAEVRDILGHATIQMTERYAHLAPENLAAALARIEPDKLSTKYGSKIA